MTSQCILWGNWFGSSTKPIDFLRHTLCASQHQYTPVFLHNRVIPVPQSQGLPHRTLTGKNIKIDFLHFLWYAAYPETLQRHPTVVLICFQWNAQGSSVAAGSGLSISLPFLTPCLPVSHDTRPFVPWTRSGLMYSALAGEATESGGALTDAPGFIAWGFSLVC